MGGKDGRREIRRGEIINLLVPLVKEILTKYYMATYES